MMVPNVMVLHVTVLLEVVPLVLCVYIVYFDCVGGETS